jgi:hypothetical protein
LENCGKIILAPSSSRIPACSAFTRATSII